jgi:hypothetical protein
LQVNGLTADRVYLLVTRNGGHPFMITEVLVASAVAVAVGVWLKWASRPVVIAYWLGREITHLIDRQSAGREAVRTRSR